MTNKFFGFDTNVLLSALLNNINLPAKAIDKARLEGTLLISKEVAEEYLEVFSRKKLEKYAPLPNWLFFIEKVISNAFPVIIRAPVAAYSDHKDDKFLSLAVNGNAVGIVSSDTDLLIMHPFQDIPILKPLDFLNDYKLTGNRH